MCRIWFRQRMLYCTQNFDCVTKTVSILGTRLLVYAPTYDKNVEDIVNLTIM